jgi:putative membrane protein
MNRMLMGGAAVAVWLLAVTASDGGAPKDDKDFVVKAFTCGHNDLRLSELADKHSKNDKVKDFAKKMVSGFNQFNDKLSKMASDQKIAVVAAPEKDDKELFDRLSKLDGADFDKEYMKAMVAGHEKLIQLCETQEKQGKDANLTTFVKTMLPYARDHLTEAKNLATEVNKQK